MVDKTVLATKVASVRDAVDRIRAVLPAEPSAFASNRTIREIVVLNLFVALQECVSLATHWIADDGLDVPPSYGEVFRRLGDRGVIEATLAERLAAAAGFRNLVAHRYGVLDWNRVYFMAREQLDHLLAFCDKLVDRASGAG
jgi:uncharacterized protein YutE (UPF0331/DUF86 family)